MARPPERLIVAANTNALAKGLLAARFANYPSLSITKQLLIFFRFFLQLAGVVPRVFA
jgi:hypothetical protein